MLAFEVRKMAVEAIQADARDLKLTIEGIGQEVKERKGKHHATRAEPIGRRCTEAAHSCRLIDHQRNALKERARMRDEDKKTRKH